MDRILREMREEAEAFRAKNPYHECPRCGERVDDDPTEFCDSCKTKKGDEPVTTNTGTLVRWLPDTGDTFQLHLHPYAPHHDMDEWRALCGTRVVLSLNREDGKPTGKCVQCAILWYCRWRPFPDDECRHPYGHRMNYLCSNVTEAQVMKCEICDVEYLVASYEQIAWRHARVPPHLQRIGPEGIQ